MIHIDTDACNDSRAFQLSENAGTLPGLDQHVVGPTQVTGEVGHFEDRLAGGQAERQSNERQRAGRESMPQNDGDIEARAKLGVPGSTIASLPSGLFVCTDDGPGFAPCGS